MPAAPDPALRPPPRPLRLLGSRRGVPIERLLDRVEEIGQPAVALTDHGVMSGAVELYRKATARGITPVVGLEAYVVPDHAERPDARAAQPPHAARRDHRGLLQPHPALLGRLPRGLPPQAAHLPRAHGPPRRRHHRPVGVPVGRRLRGARAGRRGGRAGRARRAGPDLRPRRRLRGDPARRARACRPRINAHLRRLAADAGLPMVATCDAHYPCREDADAHEALLAIQTRDLLSNPSRFRFDTKEFYLKTGAEMAAALPGLRRRHPGLGGGGRALRGPDAAARRHQAAALPGARAARRAEAYLERLCREGIGRALPAAARRPRPRSACASSSASSARWASPATS